MPVKPPIRNGIHISTIFPKSQRLGIRTRVLANEISLARERARLKPRVPLMGIGPIQRKNLANSLKVSNRLVNDGKFRVPNIPFPSSKGLQRGVRGNNRWKKLAGQFVTKAMNAGFSESYARRYAQGEIRRLRSKEAANALKERAKATTAHVKAKTVY